MSEVSEDRLELTEKLAEQEILRQSLEASKAKEKDLFDQLLRLKAEFENYRKRVDQQVIEARKLGQEVVLLQMISIGDALYQAEAATQNATDVKALKQGLSLVHRQFEKFLKDQGLKTIKTIGEKFDPHLHEAISQEVNGEAEEGLILKEIQRGYSLNGRIIRPARVSVSTKPKEEALPEPTKEEQHE